MQTPRSLSQTIYRNLVVILAVLSGTLGAVWLTGDLRHLRDDLRKSERQFTEARQHEVRSAVEAMVQRIEMQIGYSAREQERVLRERVDQAWAMADHLARVNRGRLSDDAIVDQIREALRPIRFDGGSGYYFLLDLEGFNRLQPDRPDLEGTSILDPETPGAGQVGRDLIALARGQGAGPYRYRWYKPGAEGADHPKASYVRFFEPLGLVVGTGRYEDDVRQRLQEAMLQRIDEVTLGEDGYFFVNTYDGEALVIRSATNQRGDNIWELTDPNGVKVIQEERRAVENPDGDYIFYSWNKPGFTEPVPKVSFIKGVPQWRWMVGTGVYLDDVQAAVAVERRGYQLLIGRVALSIVLIFTGAFLLALVLTRRFLRRLGGEFENLQAFFADAALSHRRIDRESLAYSEFRGLARSVNAMLDERTAIEKELLKNRNLESLGVLAGGIAHDFNNLLTTVLGNVSLARMDVEPGSEAGAALAQAERGALRAGDLTQQLLAFSRGGAPVRSLADLGSILRESAGFSLRGSHIELKLDLTRDLWSAEVDAGQISQVINNLVINAGQAMPDGGTITITARNRTFDRGVHQPLTPGDYVEVAVRDQGQGIPAENLIRIFDPYFTTKPQGTGLGLASVYAIISHHQGCITADSEPGHGACFTFWLPASSERPLSAPAADGALPSTRGRVLVMDDEEGVRRVCGQMLERLGCEVAYAAEGRQALQLYEQARADGNPFLLVVLDLTIRGGMGGLETLQRLRAIDPAVVAVVSTGYSNDPVVARLAEHGFAGALNKPYRLEEMRELLGRLM